MQQNGLRTEEVPWKAKTLEREAKCPEEVSDG
jgi:hypothetical protein